MKSTLIELMPKNWKIQTIERADESYIASLAWFVVSEISGRKGSSRSWIRASFPKERMKLWKEHFEGLLGQPPVVDNEPITRVFDALLIKTGDFTMKKLREAIKSTQENKATGHAGIPAEVWKLECFNDQLLEVCNRACHGDIPDMWLKGVILPFPKKGDLGPYAPQASRKLRK